MATTEDHITTARNDATTERLERYEDTTAPAMVGLALVYLSVFAVEVLVVDLPSGISLALTIAGNAIWLTFVLDLCIRTYLAPHRLGYLARHPIDVIACLVPAFRALRVLRVLTAGQWLVQRGARLAVGRVSLAIVVAVVFLAFVGALSVLDAERGAPDANITNLGDGLWWAAVTMSTVGYGDHYPVTAQGEIVAVGMMVVGVALLGVVSATLATGFIARIRGEQESEFAVVLARLDAMQGQIAALTAALDSTAAPPSHPAADSR